MTTDLTQKVPYFLASVGFTIRLIVHTMNSRFSPYYILCSKHFEEKKSNEFEQYGKESGSRATSESEPIWR